MKDEIKLSLLNKYQRNALTEPEAAIFFAWYHQAEAVELHRLLPLTDNPPLYEAASPIFLEAMERKLSQSGKVKRLFPRAWMVAAATVLITAGALYWMLSPGPEELPTNVISQQVPDVAPGKNGAVLTLSDGRRILLDSLGNGQVANEAGAQVYMNNGSLAYDANKAEAVAMNTISTPAARQFKLVLPDQSVVWLNAGSSLTYPTAFNGKDRSVSMTGEAYFEVAKDAAKPFRVSINNKAAVEVLGTHFNINAYNNEPAIRTTLLEGSIKANAGKNEAVLKPGEQAIMNDQIDVSRNVNTSQVVAWKNGVFNFDQVQMEDAMRQLARWYDVEVIYEAGVSNRTFYGEIGRNLSLSQVLEGLKLSGINCRIEDGKRLIVLP